MSQTCQGCMKDLNGLKKKKDQGKLRLENDTVSKAVNGICEYTTNVGERAGNRSGKKSR